MSQKKYLFDSDSLINPHQKYYNQVIVPKFWEWIEIGNKNGIFHTIDKVADEINKGDEDDLLKVFINQNPSFVLATKDDIACINIYGYLQN